MSALGKQFDLGFWRLEKEYYISVWLTKLNTLLIEIPKEAKELVLPT